MMKKLLCLLLCFIMLLGFTACEETDSADSGGTTSTDSVTPAAYFEYALGSDYAVVNRYVGPDETVIIPSEIEGLPVTEVSRCCFLSLDIKKVVIPDTVELINDQAFAYCKSLVEVQIGSSVKEIGVRAFENCTSLKKADLPPRLEILSVYAFYNCDLQKVNIPKTLATIGYYAFCENKSLKSVTYEEGIHSITGEYAFSGCNAIESVTIPASVKELYIPFDGCDGLKDVYFEGNAPIKTDEEPFGEPNASIKIHYKKGSTGWDDPVFSVYTLVESEQEYKQPTYSTEFDYDVIDGSVTITNYHSDKKDVVVPEKIDGKPVTAIGPLAFYATDITSATIPDSVKKIDVKAFRYCDDLNSVDLGNGVTEIGNYAFTGCSSIKELVLPESLEKLGTSAFEGLSLITKLNIPKTLASWSVGAFSDCTSLNDLTFEEGLRTIGEGAFANCSSLESIVLPASLVNLYNAFSGCDKLTKIYVEGNGPTNVGDIVSDEQKPNITVYKKKGATLDTSFSYFHTEEW